MRQANAPINLPPVRKVVPNVAQETPVNITQVHGPWRCVDQRTGVSTYWSYGATGGLVFHGDVLSDRPAAASTAPSAPTGWTLDGTRLVHSYEQSAPVTFMVAELTLSSLRYGDERGVDVQCRRP